jgi:hypothetical protein
LLSRCRGTQYEPVRVPVIVTTPRCRLFRGNAAVLAAIAVGALAACGSSTPSGSGKGGSASGHDDDPLAGLQKCSPRSPYYLFHPEPARIVSDPEPAGANSGLQHIVNEWRVGTRREETFVSAGPGRFVITRESPCHPRYNLKHGDAVYVPGAGALKITKAPLGPKVVNWAQKRGNLQFTSKNGISGTLHLKDDTVSLSPPGSAP